MTFSRRQHHHAGVDLTTPHMTERIRKVELRLDDDERRIGRRVQLQRWLKQIGQR